MFLGLISYSFYLIHNPILVFLKNYSGLVDLPNLLLAIAAVATLAASYASWRFVETPFRKRSSTSFRSVIFFVIIGGSLLSVTGLFMHIQDGWPQRYGEIQNVIYDTARHSPLREKCHTEGEEFLPPANGCRYHATQPVEWAVLGDSHGVELSYAMANELQALSAGGIYHATKSGCPPALLFESDVPGCNRWLKEALMHINEDEAIEHVVLVWRHSLYLYGDNLKTHPDFPDTAPSFLRSLSAEEAREKYWESFYAVVAELQATGKNIWVIEPIPELGVPVDRLIFKNKDLLQAGNSIFGQSEEYYFRRNEAALSKIRPLGTSPLVNVISPRNVFCDSSRCLAVIEDAALYFDDNHLSIRGAELLSAHILSTGSKSVSIGD